MNFFSARPYRSVSAASAASPHDEELRHLVEALSDVDDESFTTLSESLNASGCLQRLRHTLIDYENHTQARDAFRRTRGFQAVLAFIRILSHLYASSELSEEENRDFFAILKESLGVLGAGLQNHLGNKRYFSTKVDAGGWQALQTSLEVLNHRLAQDVTNPRDLELFFGSLFATAIGEEVLADLYTTSRKAVGSETVTQANPTARKDLSNSIQKHVQKSLEAVECIPNPSLLPILVDLWLIHSSPRNAENIDAQVLGLSIPSSITEIVVQSRRNVVAVHTAGLLSAVLPFLFDMGRSDTERRCYHTLAMRLCEEGVTNLDDAKFFYSTASRSNEAALFLLEAIRASRKPPNIHFDLSLHGYSSVELPTTGRPFPPSNSSGYTLAVWARFDAFDPDTHTTIFGAFDPTQTCFILAYIEKDTHHLILQTSIRGSKPSVRFKSVVFELKRWYHICIVHRRPRSMTSSRASLFVDGEFTEQLKSNYPNAPVTESANKIARVQAFFGTPQDLAPNVAKGASQSKWSLASSILFQEAFSDDLVSVCYHLGPRYHGNFQDCLGSFQTYRASAALNLRNENLHPGKEEHSDIISAIRQKASRLIPEASILVNISPAAVLDSEDRNNIDESQLVKSLSKQAGRNLQQYTRVGGNAVAINGAVPAINEALTQARGVALLTGDPVVAVPQSFEDASWRIGGCAAIGLSLVHAAKNTEDVALAVEIVFETICESWRNSEAMERDNGYGILASLLRDKLCGTGISNNTNSTKSSPAIPTSGMDRNQLAQKLLRLILGFVGYDFEEPSKSVINNPLAYRVLLVDTDLWRSADRKSQELYFEQFVTFGVKCNNHRFNAKRLARMRVLKKLLEALKSETVSADAMSFYVVAFKSLLPAAMSAEMLRSVALFITYSIHKGKNLLRPKKSTRVEMRPRRSTNSRSQTPEPSNPYLSPFEVGVEVLRLYSDFLCAKHDTSSIKKFAKTVTNKWLLYLMSETSPEVVVLSTRILARLLIVHGNGYVKKFKDKSGGFVIMKHRLKRWWHLPALWPVCFAILFDVDIGNLDLERSFDLFGFLELFTAKEEAKIAYPEIFEVIMAMLQSGLKAVIHSREVNGSRKPIPRPDQSPPRPKQRLSMSTMTPPDPLLVCVSDQQADTLNTVTRFLTDLHSRSRSYRDFAVSSPYIQDILFILFPVVVGSDLVTADVELDARDSSLSFNGNDVVIRPLSVAPPILRTSNTESSSAPKRGKTLRRGSSFVLVTSETAKHQVSTSRLQQSNSPLSPISKAPQLNDGHKIVQSLLEMVISIFSDQIFVRKDFPGLALFLKTPPGFQEHQTYFESWILRNTLSHLSTAILLNQKLLWEPKVLTNLSRFFTQVGEALYEGWFVGGADAALDFSGSVLEYLQRPDIAKIKSVRLCSQAISIIRAVVFRTVLLSLSQVQDSDSLAFLNKLTYWQTVLLSSEEIPSEYLRLVCYLLYASLISNQEAVRMAAANLWRIILVQKPGEASAIFNHATTSDQRQLAASFEKLVEIDNETFLYWVDERRAELDPLFFDTLAKSWDTFVAEENVKTEETARQRLAKRREKLKQWQRDDSSIEDIIRRHEVTFDHWTSNIYASENLKHQRVMQDQQDNSIFTAASFTRMERDVRRPVGFLAEETKCKWRLDQTEGRNRMRLRVVPDADQVQQEYQPKRKVPELPSLRLDTENVQMSGIETIGVTPGVASPLLKSPTRRGSTSEAPLEPFPELATNMSNEEKADLDESFELVHEPTEDQDEYEDKNRKVMRSLHRGDQVQQVANISRIIGLEAVEGLLILGKDHLYLIDNFFQRTDGEIVKVWQAPHEERDPYVRMISGHEAAERGIAPGANEHETRSWKWADIISVSKRRFLFRDVALELFFADGRSYLLTTTVSSSRDDLHGVISAKAPQHSGIIGSMRSENTWRYESLRSPDEEPQTLGSKFANVFGQAVTNPATRRWQKGEISNFHYLMLINTMAGRTYNDLTQYPVFPWVLADYTSEELDLTDPKTFRDLSKPMGCQTIEREAEFRERYQSFAEMGDDNSPAFHYGTHYSSAMIVTSYLIRLQPFVKSYLLLQGGSFDHADRMFFSIEKAWDSASRLNMTDVRELTPEFFYLPEFLVNLNKYDFGARQNSIESIDGVELPPWAKGDPKIFIAKHREALESAYVSQHLHKWVDLIFGFKQKGEAAVEAVNVFHHLSYQGARDLDSISDPIERLATIGIIHNFGQTPHQVYQRAHPAREETRHKYKRLDMAAESLTKLPFSLYDSGERVSSLLFSFKQERLLCCAALRLNIPPHYDKYMEWGFADGSIRFYSAESRKLMGHFEHLHIGQLSCAIFADSRTLITSGTDCTILVWNLISSTKNVDLQPKSCLFGHRTPVTVMALSRSFSALISASTDGEVFLWDLNRLEFVRRVSSGRAVECASINDVTGNIMLCRGSRIEVYTLNAEQILEQEADDKIEDTISSCAFYEGSGNEWLERDVLFTGHKRGVAKVWSKVIQEGKFFLDLIRQLDHVVANREDGSNVAAGISCILPMPNAVYTGDEEGRVYEWDCVQRH